MMLALSFIFGSLRSVTAGARIVTGICFGFLFYVVNEIFGQMSVVFNAPAFFRCTNAKPLVYGDYFGGYLQENEINTKNEKRRTYKVRFFVR